MGAILDAESGDFSYVVGRILPFLDAADRNVLSEATMVPQMIHNHFVLFDGCVYRYSNGEHVCVSRNGERWAPFLQ